MAGLGSLARALTQQISERKSEVALYEYDAKDNLVVGKEGQPQGLRFQYFPASISVGKGANYSTKAIPGGSLPLYQWTSSGERTISFMAEFSCDVDLLAMGPDQAPMIVERLKKIGAGSRNVDIRSAMVWLEGLLLPTYQNGARDTGASLTQPPPKLLLVMPGSGIGLAGGDSGSSSAAAPDSVVCIMDNKDVTYESFFPSGLPRLVQAQLTFKQVAQIGGGITFPSRTQRMRDAVFGDPFYGYPLYARTKI